MQDTSPHTLRGDGLEEQYQKCTHPLADRKDWFTIHVVCDLLECFDNPCHK